MTLLRCTLILMLKNHLMRASTFRCFHYQRLRNTKCNENAATFTLWSLFTDFQEKPVRGATFKPLKNTLQKKHLTLSLLPLPQDGVQPLLLVLGVLGHAHEPLVLRRVVDLPAIGHRVVVAVIVGCRAKTKWEENTISALRMIRHDRDLLSELHNQPSSAVFFLLNF